MLINRNKSLAAAAVLLGLLSGAGSVHAQGTYTNDQIDALTGAYASGTFILTTDATNTVLRTASGTFSGSAAITKTGAGDGTTANSGTVVLSGTNTYSGYTTVSSGTLNVTGSLSGSVVFANGGNVVFDANGKTSTLPADRYGKAVKIGDAQGTTGAMTIKAGTVNVASTDNQASINLGTNGSAGGVLTIDGGKLHVDGRILMAANQNVSKATLTINAGELDLGVPGKYTNSGDPACGVLWIGSGTSTIDLNGGTLSLYAMINNGPLAGSVFNLNGGTIKAVADNNSSFLLNGSKMKFNVLAGGAKFDTNGYNITVSPALLGSANDGGLTKLGAGTLTLSGANTYTGETMISAGTLKLTNAAAITNTSFSISAGATLDLTALSGEQTVKMNSAQGSIVRNDASDATLVIPVDDGKELAFSPNVSGVPTIKKTGTGTLNLEYAEAGPLKSGSILSQAGNVNLKGFYEATLEIVGGTVSPGIGLGSANVTGDFTLDPIATLTLEVGADPITGAFAYDQLNVNGNVVLSDKSVINLTWDQTKPGGKGSYDLISTKNGTITYGSTFDWAALLSDAGFDTNYWLLTPGETSLTLAYTVPEPSTWAILLLGTFGIAFLRRKRGFYGKTLP